MIRSSLVIAAALVVGCNATPANNQPGQPAAGQQAAGQPAADGKVDPAATPEPDKPALPPRPAAERKANSAEPGHCDFADLSMKDESVIASVDGTDIKVSELGDDFVSAEKKALSTYCTELDRIRTAAVERAVQDKLLDAAAKAEGKDADTYLKDAVTAAVVEPTDAEMSAYYEKFKREGAPEFDQVRPQVQRAMMEERSKEAFEKIIDGLKAKAQIQTMLPDVRPPAQELDIPEHAGTFGPEGATVEVVEFSDFECPYCAQAATAVSEVKKKYGDKVKFAFRHFPLSFHPNARPAAEYAHCANEQDKFWAMHDEIFANQKALGTESLRAAAQTAGLDIGKLDQCLASDRPGKAIEEDMKKATEVGVQGTPSFYINGRPFEGGISGDALGAAIDAELG